MGPLFMNARSLTLWLALALATATLTSACWEPEAPCVGALGCGCAASACNTDLVCDEASSVCREPISCVRLGCVADQVCIEATLGTDATCQEGCDPGMRWDASVDKCVPAWKTCVADAATSIASECATANKLCVEGSDVDARCGECVDGFVSETGSCRAVRTCADLGTRCSDDGRTCVAEQVHQDAYCAPCVVGQTTAADGSCIAATCAPEGEGSVLASCTADARVCVADAQGARCTACVAGYIEGSDGKCRAVRTCADAGCATQHRGCEIASAHEDASCLACVAGYSEIDSRCEPTPGATCATIAAACASEHRGCDADKCGACVAGYVEDPDSKACREPVDCATCTAEGRLCADVGGVNVCGGCAAGFKSDAASGDCVPVATCADITCDAGDSCVPAEGSRDAYCRPDCGNRAVWDETAATCVACPVCEGPGSDQGRSIVSDGGECVCVTKPGYYFTRGGEIGIYPCDADDDGWVREPARAEMGSSDAAIRSNARCAVRYADEVRLENDAGQEKTLTLDAPLALYESARNDDDALLRSMLAAQGVDHGFGADASNGNAPRLTARNVNSLTKFCHEAQADYNDNGVADVAEYQEMQVSGGRSDDIDELNGLSYWGELHLGWFIADPTSTTNHGTYVVKERSRKTTSGEDHVAVRYADGASSYWKECRRGMDALSEQDSIAPVGTDFSSAGASYATGWYGMGHHSQFKCVVTSALASEANAWEVSPVGDPRLVMNDCKLVAEAGTLGDGNPVAPSFQCTALTTKVPAGKTRWAAVGYVPYANGENGASGYVRGCLDECAEVRAKRTTPSNPCQIGASFGYPVPCDGSPTNFGKLACRDACGDGIDNDGDGRTDNPPAELGDVGNSCTAAAKGECNKGKVGCDNGGYGCVAATPAGADWCDGLDNDCDGALDENPTEPDPITRQGAGDVCQTTDAGVCGTGNLVCTGSALMCEATIEPGDLDEVCDGKDNDCDGTTDTDDTGKLLNAGACLPPTPPGGVAPNTKGVCAKWSKVCAPPATPNTNPSLNYVCKQEVAASVEICDGLDNDCDGQADEGDVCTCSVYYPLVGNRSSKLIKRDGDKDYNGNETDVTTTWTATQNSSGGITLKTEFSAKEVGNSTNATVAESFPEAVTKAQVEACGGVGATVSEVITDRISILGKNHDDGNQYMFDSGALLSGQVAYDRENAEDIWGLWWLINAKGDDDTDVANINWRVRIRFKVQNPSQEVP